MNADALEQIRHFYQINDRIATAGQPTAEQFNIIKQTGFDVVINLALSDPPNAIENEDVIVRQASMEYEHIPVNFKAPASDDLQRFFIAMEQHQSQHVFIHCALNRRVSAFIFLYNTIKMHHPVMEALNDLHAVWTPDEVWQEFIDSSLMHFNIQY